MSHDRRTVGPRTHRSPRHRSTVLALALLAGALPTAAAQEWFRSDCEIKGYRFGFRIEALGDIDRDGVTDFVASGLGKHIEHRYKIGIYSGRDGHRLHGTSRAADTGWGYGLGALGDLDGDGFADYAMGDPWQDTVVVLSGSDSHELGQIQFGTPGMFGWMIHSHPDLDGDGVPDILVGAPGEIHLGDGDPNEDGFVHAYSGADLHLLFTIVGVGKTFAWDLVTADVDGDGVQDLVVGSPEEGVVEVYSGTDQSLLRHWSKIPRFGTAVDRVPDLDGDGCDEVLVGAPSRIDWTWPGRAYLFSGRTGSRIHKWEGAVGDTFGTDVVALDFDGDGLVDYAVGPDGMASSTDEVSLFSGRDGELLQRIRRPRDAVGSSWFGSALATAGDLDGDGLEEILIGDGGSSGASELGGAVFAFRGNELSLSFSTRDPLSGQPLDLRIGQAAAGALALLVLEEIDGVPYGGVVLGPVPLGGNGILEHTAVPPADLAARELTLRAYVLEPGGRLRTSARESLRVQ